MATATKTRSAKSKDATPAAKRAAAKARIKARERGFQELFEQAHKAGMKAGEAANPVPMIVERHAHPMDDNSPVVERWRVEDGICGFAWVNVSNGRTAFAQWLAKTHNARQWDGYRGRFMMVHAFGQSLTRKQAYAAAFSDVLSKAGIESFPFSRMD